MTVTLIFSVITAGMLEARLHVLADLEWCSYLWVGFSHLNCTCCTAWHNSLSTNVLLLEGVKNFTAFPMDRYGH